MTKLTEATGVVLSAGITQLFHSKDQHLLDQMRLTVNILEGTANSGLHPRSKQLLLEHMQSAQIAELDGRKHLIRAHRQMIAIKSQSNLDVVDYGCWGPGPDVDDGQRARFFTGASLETPQPV